jgi:hypothetical protein
LRRSRPTRVTIPVAAGRQGRAGDGAARAGAKRTQYAGTAPMTAYVRRAGALIGTTVGGDCHPCLLCRSAGPACAARPARTCLDGSGGLK